MSSSVPTERGIRADVAAIDDLRAHTARGTIFNAGYQIFLSGLALAQRLIAAAFLTAGEFGLWAVILTVLINLGWIKELGVMDKYLQQSEPDQELAFQRAFTVELYSSLGLFALVAAVLPLWALAYGHGEIVPAGLAMALTFPLAALQAPTWIPYRRLQYRRQRALLSVAALVGFVVTVAAAIAGAGYWCFVAGALAGNIIGGAVCVATSPYPLRLRFDRAVAREYASFSWPLAASGLSSLVLVQGSLLIVHATAGLAGIGAIGLVFGIVSFAERVDTVVGQTLYPAICAVVGRVDLTREIFLKSNRVALLWAIPFSVGLALFAGDLITFFLGEKWRAAETLLVVISLSVGLGQVAFNWMMFFRAANQTRPIFVVMLTRMAVFLVVLAIACSALGLEGYGIASASVALLQVVMRSVYMRRLVGHFGALTHALRSIAVAVPAAAAVLLVRVAETGPRTLGWALVELTMYAAITAGTVLVLERRLIEEIVGYLRRGTRSRTVPAG